MDEDPVHFLVKSVPNLSVTKLVTIVKSVTAGEIFVRHKEAKRKLRGGNLLTGGFHANTVSEYANAEGIQQYMANQGACKKTFGSTTDFRLVTNAAISDTPLLAAGSFIQKNLG